MSNIYCYKNRLWKVVNEYTYTGTVESVQLDPGEYLLICNGAQGGVTTETNASVNYGGSAYGVLSLQNQTNAYISVGGNGGSPPDSISPGAGGFNGGGKGGKSVQDSYIPGAGGGGASDIRVGSDSLYSRLIVAGGGGGCSNISTYMNYTGNGGGAVGGILLSGSDSINYNKYASQTEGYSFGIGMSAVDKTDAGILEHGNDGASGGGGGWYGGYANGSSDKIYSSSNGGGGSGYVLTSSSYKPEGYLLGEEYYLTDTFLDGGSAIDPSVIICKLTKRINDGDIIIFPCVGWMENITLPTGQYNLKCYGGDGGCRNLISESQRGGYAMGKLTLSSETSTYVSVGGSGIGTSTLSATYPLINRPTTSYNGGGAPGAFGVLGGCAGGGCTDIRIGSNSLLSRVIVAGGAGGNSINLGGNGGGLTGGTGKGSYGTSAGPGTQNSSPQNSTYTTINGGFGYGGNGYNKSTTLSDGSGGAGGGGWYGGSGVYPDTKTDDDMGGNGGSGYVLTSSSYKPEGYLLGEEYYLTDTSLVSGGNNLPIGHTKAVIEVINSSQFFFVCHDNEGYKKFDTTLQKWVFLSETIDTSMIEMNGSTVFINDEGLLDEYEVIFIDDNDEVDNLTLSVSPIVQNIKSTVNSDMFISRLIDDSDYDSDKFSINYSATRQNGSNGNTITLSIDVDKKETADSSDTVKIYCIQIFSK